MKSVVIKSTLILGLYFVSLSPVSADNPSPELQDTQRAAHFFKDKASYETNAYSVSKMIEEKAQNVNIVDVRASNDFAKSHIPGAINIPFDKFNSFEGVETDFPGLHKDRVNIVYCYGLGCSLGPKAAAKFASLGYPVKEIVGGYMSWTDSKLPVETTK